MQWLTKNPSYPEPLAINHEAERGNYVVFNHKEWRRESVSFHPLPKYDTQLTVERRS